jgi:hypothetical protein
LAVHTVMTIRLNGCRHTGNWPFLTHVDWWR